MKALFRTAPNTGLAIIRIATGLMFVLHGSQKLFGWFGGHGINGFAAFLQTLGLPHPHIQACLAGGSEFFGGLFLIVGCFTRLAVLPLMVVMLIAITKVHWVHGFFGQNGGFEYPLILLVILIAFLINGAGSFSADHQMSKE